jgi:hypothetical protein
MAGTLCREAVTQELEIPEYNTLPVEAVSFTDLLEYRKKWRQWVAAD